MRMIEKYGNKDNTTTTTNNNNNNSENPLTPRRTDGGKNKETDPALLYYKDTFVCFGDIRPLIWVAALTQTSDPRLLCNCIFHQKLKQVKANLRFLCSL